MQNPYHRAEARPHFLDRAVARTMCFDIFNIFAASYQLGGEFELADPEEGDARSSSKFRLHHELAEPRLSQLLLQLAVFVRTFDDVFSTGNWAESYAAHAAAAQGENFIGVLSGADLGLREACNKIIHASDFRPVYDRAEREERPGDMQQAWFLTGEIELSGTLNGRVWEATLYTQNFLEIVLDRISFDPEAL